MHYQIEFMVVLVLSLILLIGAITRYFSPWIKVPFTISILLLGLFSGLIVKYLGGKDGLFGLFHLSGIEPIISSHLIVFVFLPALVFESAFTLDAHLFKKSLGVTSALAGPALIFNTILSAIFIMFIMPEQWHWTWVLALTFGALISATDPVTVTSVLRELGLPKRLVTIIEGESLLNDGTSIVIFTILIGLVTGGVLNIEVGAVLSKFLYVVLGGCFIGLVLAWMVSLWMGKVFNDPLVEITLTIVLAYMAMLVAEGFFHVSGIMAVVVAGLWMSKSGRTSISPEVGHFLHQFWEVLSYIANTVIFYLVGLTIAQVPLQGWTDLYLIFMVYIGIMVIRFAVTYAFKWLYNLFGYHLSGAYAFVISWSGLRGAVSLALALLVFHNTEIAMELRRQILIVTVGVVFLTIIINGSMIKFILSLVGLDNPPIGEKISSNLAQTAVLNKTMDYIHTISQSPDLKSVMWGEMKDETRERQESLSKELVTLKKEMERTGRENQDAECWVQALNIERQGYWEAFGQGVLGERAVKILTYEIDIQLDKLLQNIHQAKSIIFSSTKRVSRFTSFVQWIDRVMRWNPLTHHLFEWLEFSHISLQYDLARGEEAVARKVLERLESLKGIGVICAGEIKKVYMSYLQDSKKRLEEMRCNLPKITSAIETHIARRVALNIERDEYKGMLSQGLVDENVAKAGISSVEEQMKRLRWAAKSVTPPTTVELLGEAHLFSRWSEEDLQGLAKETIEIILSPGDVLFREGDKGDGLFIIVRGAVNVVKNIKGEDVVIAILGGGDIFGEMALLTGQLRTASITAVTTVMLLKIGRETFKKFEEKHPRLSEETWWAYAAHTLDNVLHEKPVLRRISTSARRKWISMGKMSDIGAHDSIKVDPEVHWMFVVSGLVVVDSEECQERQVVSVENIDEVTASVNSKVVWLPRLF